MLDKFGGQSIKIGSCIFHAHLFHLAFSFLSYRKVIKGDTVFKEELWHFNVNKFQEKENLGEAPEILSMCHNHESLFKNAKPLPSSRSV